MFVLMSKNCVKNAYWILSNASSTSIDGHISFILLLLVYIVYIILHSIYIPPLFY